MTSYDRKGPLYMVAASVCWSFGGLCIKYVPWDAMSIVGLRAVLATIVFIIYRKSFRIDFTFGNILAALCLSGVTILFVFANKLTTAAAAILLQFSAPVFIIILQFFLYKTKPKLAEIIAVTVTISGMLLFFADSLEASGFLGNILAIIAGLCYAGVFLFNKRPDTIPEQATLLGFLINCVVGLPFAFFGVNANILAWGSVTFMGIVQVGLAYLFFTIGIKKTSALLACLITALEPILNPTLVAFATGEKPGPYSIAGGAVIIIAVVSYNVWATKHPRTVTL